MFQILLRLLTCAEMRKRVCALWRDCPLMHSCIEDCLPACRRACRPSCVLPKQKVQTLFLSYVLCGSRGEGVEKGHILLTSKMDLESRPRWARNPRIALPPPRRGRNCIFPFSGVTVLKSPSKGSVVQPPPRGSRSASHPP